MRRKCGKHRDANVARCDKEHSLKSSSRVAFSGKSSKNAADVANITRNKTPTERKMRNIRILRALISRDLDSELDSFLIVTFYVANCKFTFDSNVTE